MSRAHGAVIKFMDIVDFVGFLYSQIPVLQIPMTYCVCLVFFTGYLQVFISFCQSFREGGVGKNGSTVAVRAALMSIFFFILL